MKALLSILLLLASLVNAAESFSQDYYEKIVKNKINRAMQQMEIPGVAVVLYFEGKSQLYNFGLADISRRVPVTPRTLFEIGSITKVFTSTALALEVLNHKMELKDSIAKYIFPRGHFDDRPIAQVTLEDLATHTSSLPRVPQHGNHVAASKEQVLNFLKNWNPSYPIATKYVYSNLGFGVIGYALAEQEKRSYFEVLQEFILNPLKMHATVIHVPQSLEPYYAQGYAKDGKPAPHFALNAWPAGGALRSNALDMQKFLIANLGVEGPQELMRAMQFAQQGIFKVNNRLTLGLGWQRFSTSNKALIVDKNGGVPGFSTYIGMLPDKKMGIVILANKTEANMTEIGRKILEMLSSQLVTESL